MSDGSDLSARSREGEGQARFTSITVKALDSSGEPLEVAYPGCDLCIEVRLRCDSNFSHANVAVVIFDVNGYRLLDVNTAQKGEFVSMRTGQIATANFRLRDVLLRPGQYLIGLWIGREGSNNIDYVEHAGTVDFAEGEETKGHAILYPGRYLCRFEEEVAIT